MCVCRGGVVSFVILLKVLVSLADMFYWHSIDVMCDVLHTQTYTHIILLITLHMLFLFLHNIAKKYKTISATCYETSTLTLNC